MGIGNFLIKIPWRDILRQAPLIVETTKKMYETMSNPVPSRQLPGKLRESSASINDLQAQVDQLRRNEAEQAKLVSTLAEQVRALSDALQVVNSRLTLFIGIAVLSTLISIILAVVELLR